MKKRRRNRDARHTLLAQVQQKNSARRWRGRSSTIGLYAGIFILTCSLAWFGTTFAIEQIFFKNPDFALQKIEIHTTGALTRREILETARIPRDANLMSINLQDIHNRMLSMPYVASARVERRIPGTLSIQLEERQPVARLMPHASSGKRLVQQVFYIDSSGHIMKPKPGERIKPLPVIMGIADDSLIDGQRTDRPELLSAINLLRMAEMTNLRSDLDLDQVEVFQRGYLVLRTRDQGIIRFRTDHINQQIHRLRFILDDARQRQLFVRTVDLTPERNVPVTYY